MNLVRTIVVFGGVYAISALVFVKGNLLGFKIFSLEHKLITLTFVNHNHFAGFLEMIIWLSLGLVLSYKGVKRILLICLGMCIAVAILFSLSRGGTIGLLGGLLFFILITAFCRGWKKIVSLFLVFLAIVLLVVTLLGGFNPVFDRMSTLKTPAITGESRLRVWNDTLNIIKENPWLGRGIGTFKYVYPRYQTELINSSFNHAHNSYLELTSEIGIVGILSCLLIIVILFIGGIKRIIAQHDKQLQAIGIGSLAGCFSVLIHEVTDFNLYIPSNAFLFTTCAAISVISTKTDDKPFHLMHIQLSDGRKWLFCFVIFLLSILSLAGVLSPFIGNIYHKEAKYQERLKNYDLASKAMKSAIFVDFGNAEFMASMGDLMAKNASAANNPAESEKFYSASITHYDNAIYACPVRSYFYNKKAFSLMRLDKSKAAEEAFIKAVYFSPMDVSNYLNLGTFYLEQGDHDKAYREYKDMLLIDENYLATVLDAIWEVSPSYHSLSQAVPETAVLRRNFASYLLKKGLYDDSKKELSFALSLESTPEEFEVSLSQKLGKKYLNRNDIQMAKIYEKAGRYDKAVSIYHQLITKHGENQKSSGFFQRLFNNESDAQVLYTELASLYSKMGRYQESISILEKGLNKWPDNKRLQQDMKSGIAENYTKQAQYDKAISIYKQIIDAGDRPVWTELYIRLVHLYNRTAQYQEAINTLHEGVRQWPDDKKLKRALNLEIAENFNRQKQYGKAIPLYRQLIDEDDSPRADFYFTLAVMYSRTAQYQEAINTLHEGVRQWPDDKKLKRALNLEIAENFNRQKQYGKAIPLYRQLIDEDDSPRADFYFTLAVMYSRTAQYQEAINTLQEGVKRWPNDRLIQQTLKQFIAENYNRKQSQ